MATDSIREPSGQLVDAAATALVAFGKAVRKQWTLVLACTLLAAGLGLLYSKSAQKVYQASALLEIDPHVTQPLGEKDNELLDLGTGNYWDTRDYYETQYKIMASDRVLSNVARDLALTNDKGFMGHGTTVEDATAILHHALSVEPVHNSRLVYLRVEDVDPARAKRLCDAIANAYIEQNLLTAQNATTDAAVWLNGQLDHVKGDLERDENSLYEFKQHNDLPSTSINEASNMLRVEMQELDTALTRTRTRKQELSARYNELAKVPADNPDELPASELLSSLFLQSLRKEYQQATKDRDALLAEGKADNHPAVKSATAKVAETRSALLAEVRNIQGAVARDLAAVTREEAGEGGLFEATRKRAVDLNMKEIEYHRLDRSREQDEKLYAMLVERMKDADLARMMKANNIRVVDFPLQPATPIRPRTVINTALALLGGLAMGLLLAWIRDRLDSTIKTPDELEEKLGVTFLGLFPEIDDNDPATYGRRRRRRAEAKPAAAEGPPELVVHHRPLSGIAEAARAVRTNVMFMNPDRPHKTLLITSSAPSEGKTTVACTIAIALAQGGQRVCIVDCDLRRSRLHRIFGRSGDMGVTNFLVNEATIDDLAKPTVVDNLWSIPAGPTPPNPADVLHSARFKRFIELLGERFDRVVIDSPPIVAVTDSAIISTLVDGIVFVVRAFKTNRRIATQGLRSLRDVDAPVVGAVLNAVNLDRAEYSYYQQYYYYKREGYLYTPTATDGESSEHSASPPN